MFKKWFLAFVVLLAFSMVVSAATVDVATSVTAREASGATATYTLVQENDATAQNCTLYSNVDGSWGVDTSVSMATVLVNGSNSFSIPASSFSTFARGDTALYNVLCYDNATGSAKDATNGTITYYVYASLYSTADLNEQVVDVFGTGIAATIDWIDLLVLLAIVGVGLSIVMGILFKGGRIFGLN